jgi:hypothetical protein
MGIADLRGENGASKTPYVVVCTSALRLIEGAHDESAVIP